MLLSLTALALIPASITVDTTRSQPISPYVYGANFAPWPQVGDCVTLDRQGGNRLSAYNWETNASNAGNDFHNQNDGFMGEKDEPGLTVRTFLQDAQTNGSATLLTVPTMGFVSADKKGDGDVGNTPDYLSTRFVRSYATKRGALVYPPDVHDRAVYQDEFVHWIETIRKAGPPVWFSLDNEPDLWGSTHSRVWTRNPTYAQIVANNAEFAAGIKAQAPGALVFGPRELRMAGLPQLPERAGRERSRLRRLLPADDEGGVRQGGQAATRRVRHPLVSRGEGRRPADRLRRRQARHGGGAHPGACARSGIRPTSRTPGSRTRWGRSRSRSSRASRRRSRAPGRAPASGLRSTTTAAARS